MDNIQQPPQQVTTPQQVTPPQQPAVVPEQTQGMTPQKASQIGKLFNAIFIVGVVLMIAAFIVGLMFFGPKNS
jgi:hypothetical protein